MARLLPFLLLCACGGSGFGVADDGPSTQNLVRIFEVSPGSLGTGIVGYTSQDGSAWKIEIVAGLQERGKGVVIAHEFLHLLGLPASHGEPYPCLGGAPLPSPQDMILCDGDLALIDGAHEPWSVVVVSDSLEIAAGEASGIINAAKGSPLFVVAP